MSTADATAGGSGTSIRPASVRTIAKKDFQDAVRSWLFWGLSVFFLLLIGVVAGAMAYFGEGELTTQEFVQILSAIAKLLIPLIALLLGWKSIAGERDSGSIRILLSLPHSRRDVVLGKLVGRTAVLTVSLVIGFVIASVFVFFAVDTFSPAEYLSFIGMTVLYALAYMSIAITLSSITKSSTIAAALMFGVFVLFYVVWNLIQTALQLLMWQDYIDGVAITVQQNGGSFQFERLPDWALFIDTIDPGNAYQNALTVVSSTESSEIGTTFSYPTDVMFPDGVPFYLQDWFSFIILVLWIVVPIAVAMYRFDRVDI